MKTIFKSPWYPRAVFAACLIPLLILTWKWQQHDLGPNRVEFVARYLGDWTMRLLLATLAITPLRRVPGLAGLMKIRRMLGLFTFFYGTLHGLHYFAIDIRWDPQIIVEDLTFRRFFIAGVLAWLLMAPLAATSFDRAIRWMGGRRWQRLHRLIYFSAIAGVVHYAWQGKTITYRPIYDGAVLVFLLLVRVMYSATHRKAVNARA